MADSIVLTHVWAVILAFAVFMGVVGGLLPAARAARKQVAEALRAA